MHAALAPGARPIQRYEPAARHSNNNNNNFSANSLLKEIDLKISVNTGGFREASFLYKRISVSVQRFNVILLHDSLPTVDCADWI